MAETHVGEASCGELQQMQQQESRHQPFISSSPSSASRKPPPPPEEMHRTPGSLRSISEVMQAENDEELPQARELQFLESVKMLRANSSSRRWLAGLVLSVLLSFGLVHLLVTYFAHSGHESAPPVAGGATSPLPVQLTTESQLRQSQSHNATASTDSWNSSSKTKELEPQPTLSLPVSTLFSSPSPSTDLQQEATTPVASREESAPTPVMGHQDYNVHANLISQDPVAESNSKETVRIMTDSAADAYPAIKAASTPPGLNGGNSLSSPVPVSLRGRTVAESGSSITWGAYFMYVLSVSTGAAWVLLIVHECRDRSHLL